MYSTHVPSDRHVEYLKSVEPVDQVVVVDSDESALREATDSEIIIGHRYLRQSLPGCEKLKWVQSTAGGVDRLPLSELKDLNVCLTNMSFPSRGIARHAHTMAWAITRKIPESFQQQKHGLWDNQFQWLPEPRDAVVFGVGGIGSEIAKLLKRDGIRVRGVRRSHSKSKVPEFDQIYSVSDRTEAITGANWVFLALPHSEDTRELIDSQLMELMADKGVLINVGRGETLVTKDLVHLLNSGKLGGAGLDVIYPKPESEDDEIWRTPGLLITPHVASHSYERHDLIERFVEDQLDRYLMGEPLLNVIF